MLLAKKFITKTAISLAVLSYSCLSQANILTSIKPLGFIASSIADGVTTTDVLLPASASPHDYNIKPSDIQKVKDAKLIFWIGKDIDGFLEKTIEQIDNKKVITIADIQGIESLLSESTHHHEDHHHSEHNHTEHNHKESDKHHHAHSETELNWHIWFSPKVSEMAAIQLADKLIVQYPDKKELITRNLAEFKQSLAIQSEKIKQQLAPVKEKGFYVFHDAYGYFNDTYGLKQTGFFTINPLVAPGAKTLATIKAEINEHKVNCLFSEPQFTPKVIEALKQSTGVNIGQLDPIGDKIELGKNSYPRFLQSIADSYTQCLNK